MSGHLDTARIVHELERVRLHRELRKCPASDSSKTTSPHKLKRLVLALSEKKGHPAARLRPRRVKSVTLAAVPLIRNELRLGEIDFSSFECVGDSYTCVLLFHRKEISLPTPTGTSSVQQQRSHSRHCYW